MNFTIILNIQIYTWPKFILMIYVMQAYYIQANHTLIHQNHNSLSVQEADQFDSLCSPSENLHFNAT